MANEKIKIDVKIGGVESVEKAADAMAKLSTSTKAADKSTTDLTKTFEEVNGQGIKPLGEQIGQLEDRLYELAQAGNKGTQEFKDLAAETGRLKLAQKEADAEVDKLSKTIGEKLTGKVKIATDAFVLADVALQGLGVSSKTTEELMGGLVVAQSVSDSFASLESSTGIMTKLGTAIKKTTVYQVASTAASKAAAGATRAIAAVQWLWNAAMLANPIGAIVIAVTALIAAGYALVTMFQKASAATKKADDTNKEFNSTLKKQSKAFEGNTKQLAENNRKKLELGEASGLTKDALRELEKQLLAEEIAQSKVNYQTAEATKELAKQQVQALKNSGASKAQITAAKETASAAIKSYNAQVEGFNSLILAKRELAHQYRIEDIAEETATRERIAADAQIANEKSRDVRAAARESEKAEREQAEEVAKAAAEEKVAKQKKLDDAQVADIRATVAEITETKAEADQKELEGTEYKYNEALRLAEDNRDAVLGSIENSFAEGLIKLEEYNQAKAIIEAQYVSEVAVVEEDRAAKKATLDAEEVARAEEQSLKIRDIAKKEADEKIADEERVNALKVKGAFDAVNAVVSVLEMFGKKNKKAAKAAFLLNKGVQIAETSINTVKSATSAFSSLAAIPVVGVPLGIAAAAGATVAGLANIKKIANTKFDETGSSGGGDSPAVPAPLPEITAPEAAPSPPSLSLTNDNIGNSSQLNNTKDLGQTQQNDFRAYVVESDITNTQNTLSRYKQRSEIG